MEIHEDMPMLPNQEQIYQDGKGTKHNRDGLGEFPVQRIEEAVRRRESLPLYGQPWSTRLGGCFGCHGEFCTNPDMEVCFCGTFSPYVLYPNKSQRFNLPRQDNPAPPQQIME